MKYLIILLLIVSANSSIGQVSSAEKKKIQKIVGEDFIQLKAKSNYPFSLHPESCIVDTSRTFVGDTTGLIFNNEYVLFRNFIHFKRQKEFFSLINPKVVSVGEYQNFKDFVCDSIARFKLYQYLEFEAYVRDSVTRDVIHENVREDKEAIKFINNTKFYFGEGMLEYVDFDPSDRPINREFWTLNFKTKIKQAHLDDPLVQKVFNETDSFDKLMSFRYQTMRTKIKATEPSYEIGRLGQYNGTCQMTREEVFKGKLASTRMTIENRDIKNEFGFSSGVRLLNNLRSYIEVKHVFILLNDNALGGDLNSLIPGLSYEQAMAYYNWKYPIDKFNTKSNWQDFVYPSEEQFNAIQRGESITVPAHEVEFPTPLFRYVVHVYPK